MDFDYKNFKESAKNKFNNRYTGDRLKKLRRENGGSIVDLIEKVESTSVPTLIVGLGGLGCKTLNTTKKKYLERVRENGKKTVYFLALDTCKEDIDNLISSDTNTEGYLNGSEWVAINSDLSTNVTKIVSRVKRNSPALPQKKWMDHNINTDTLVDNQGARGVRQVGRLALSEGQNYQNVYSKVESIFKEFTSASNGRQNVTVILMAGISGGTGSGTIIDISYLFHRAALSVGAIDLSLDAIIFTPEVQHSEIPENVFGNLKRNYIAAMKEIDGFIKATNSGEEYRFPSSMFGNEGIVTPTVEKVDIGKNRSIFSSCTLVQGYDSHGALINRNIPIETVSSYVVNLVSDINPTDNGGIPVPLQTAILNNDNGNAAQVASQYINNYPGVPRDVYYTYRTLGYREVTFPVEAIMTYVANKTTEALQRKYEVEPRKNEYEVLSAAGISSVENIFTLGKNNITTKSYIDSLSNFDFIEIRDGVNTKGHTQALTKKDYDSSWVENAYKSIVGQLNEEMKANGPFASLRLSQRVYENIEKTANNADGYYNQIRDEISESEHKLGVLIDKARKHTVNPFSQNHLNGQQKDELAADFNSTMRRFDNASWREQQFDIAIDALRDLFAKVVEQNNKIFENYVGALCAINDVLKNDSTAIVKTAAQESDSGIVFSSSMINPSDLEVNNSRLRGLLDYYITEERINRISENLINEMLQDPEAWISNKNTFEGVEKIKERFKIQFEDLTDNIIQRFLVIKYTSDEYTSDKVSVEQISDEMDEWFKDRNHADPWITFDQHCLESYGIAPLRKAAEEIFAQATSVGHCAVKGAEAIPGDFNEFYNYKFICLMKRTRDINRIIQGDASASIPPLPAYEQWKRDNGVVAEADISQVFCVQVVCGVPLYFFKNMDGNQQEYTSALHSTGFHNAGMHMDCGKDSTWAKFPPIVNNDALRLVYSPNELRKRQDYKDEEDILSDIKRKADICKDKYGMIKKLDDTDEFFTLYYIDENEPELLKEWHDKTLENYIADVKKAIENVGEIDIESAEPEEFWENSFKEAFGSKTLMDYMKEGGYAFSTRPLRTYNCLNMNFTDTGDFNAYDNAQSGGFYKTIRRSTKSRNLLNEGERQFTELFNEFEAERTKLIQEAKSEAVKVYKRAKQSAMVELFIKSLITGNLVVNRVQEQKKLDISIKTNSNSNPALIKSVRYAAGRPYEQKYILYAVFACYFMKYKEGNSEFWERYSDRVDEEYGENYNTKVYGEAVGFIKNFDDLSDIDLNDISELRDYVNQLNKDFEASKVKSKAFPPMDQTSLSLDEYYEGYDFGYSFGSQVMSFYKKIAEYEV